MPSIRFYRWILVVPAVNEQQGQCVMQNCPLCRIGMCKTSGISPQTSQVLLAFAGVLQQSRGDAGDLAADEMFADECKRCIDLANFGLFRA